MRALLWFLLIIGIVSVGVLVYLGVSPHSTVQAVGEQVTSAPLGSAALFLATMLIWPLIGVFTILVMVAMIRWLWATLKLAVGHDTVPRLLSGGITALLFSGTIQSVFSPLIELLFELFGRIPSTIANVWLGSDLFKRCGQQNADEFASNCLQPVLGNVSVIGTETLNRFGNRIAGMDIALLFAAIAIWVLLGQLFSTAMQAHTPQGARSRWAGLLDSLADKASPARANLLLFAIIAAGGTLSASALIAIPVISDSTPLSDKDIQQAQSEIDALLADEVIAKHVPAISPVDTKISAAAKELRQEFAASASAPAQSPPVEMASIDAYLAQLDRDAEYLEDDARRFWLEVRDATKRQMGDLKDTAHDSIARQNLAVTSLRNKAGYLLDVKNWVANTSRAALRQADMCRSMVEEASSGFKREARYELGMLRDFPSASRKPQSLTDDLRIRPQARAACTGYVTPQTPGLASLPSLGPFSFATWLIALSSMSLTLVAGMLGFGLLGAAISSIVRDRKLRSPREPLVKDLSGLLVRGMSATVVVYLAVKGGLAIFTGVSAPDPNAYVLLLTCFVASVFSDDVWAAAKAWLKSKLAPQDEVGGKSLPQVKPELERVATQTTTAPKETDQDVR